MHKKFGILLSVALLSSATLFAAQQNESQPTIKPVPIKPTSSVSGADMFKQYCAVCHGTDGKGNGPAAAALKVPPSDLTTLAKENKGKFPDAHVAAILHGSGSVTAHGSTDMPVWGPLFKSLNRGNPMEEQQRVSNLTRYLETMQVK